MNVTIYHNTACGTSRKTLGIIRDADIEPTIIEYLKTPPSRAILRDLAQRMGVPLHDLLRQKGTPYNDLGLNPATPANTILAAIETHPILLNRPIVVTPNGARLCRPAELVQDLLATSPDGREK